LSTGTYYLRARHYNPTTGRFTQPDPFWNIHNMQGSSGAIMQAANLYVFVTNNPVMFIDPTGLWRANVHFSYTRRWAIEAGFTELVFNRINVNNYCI